MEEVKPEEKKGFLKKLKENVDDHDEQMAILGAIVRLGVVVWSGFIVSLNYIELPGYSNEPKDITFPASLLTAAISTFGIEASRKNGSKKDDKVYSIIEMETATKELQADSKWVED